MVWKSMQKHKLRGCWIWKEKKWSKKPVLFWAETSKFWHHSNNVPNPKNIHKGTMTPVNDPKMKKVLN